MVGEVVRLHGPFHGMIGFSQGSALAALICLQTAIRRYKEIGNNVELGLQNQINEKNPQFPVELDVFKFAILFSGFRSHSSQHSYIYQVWTVKLII